MPVWVSDCATGDTHRLGDPEVRDHRMTALQQDVLRLDVAMDHAACVRVAQRVGDFAGDLQRSVNGKLLFPVETIAQRFAFDERHDIEEVAVGLAGVVQWQDVRMTQIRRDPDLGEKPLGAQHRTEFRFEHLDRHLAVVLEIVGEVHRRHPAGAELALDTIAIGEWAASRAAAPVPSGCEGSVADGGLSLIYSPCPRRPSSAPRNRE